MKKFAKEIKTIVNELNLKHATDSYLLESEKIKTEVRSKMLGIAQQHRCGDTYQALVAIQNQVEAKHDQIYKRPNTGVSKDSAVNDCIKMLGEQKIIKLNFDTSFNNFISLLSNNENRPRLPV